jgi:glycine/D-amino acid oxidase-like deaminating enzyme
MTADVVVVGAGIAGVSVAFQLAVRRGVSDVVLIDPRPPLSLTSDKSTECYRNWWPDQAMVDLMNRSIDIYEDLAGQVDFGFNRHGYLYVTGRAQTLECLKSQIDRGAALGADAELLDAAEVRGRYPFLTPSAVGAVRVDRAGWFRARDLGQWMLDQARGVGVRLLSTEVSGISPRRVSLGDGTAIDTPTVVIAAGPMAPRIAASAGIDLPLHSELHLKVAFKDHLGVIPRQAPLTIWTDAQLIDWSEEERSALQTQDRSDLLDEMPVNCHFRPEGGADSPYVVALWEYHGEVGEPVWPLPEDPMYPEVVMRGLTTMVPGLEVYRDRLPESHVDGGYYTKTLENRPLIGPSGIDGVYLVAGLSGFGVMAAAGAAELLAAHILGDELPDNADAFLLSRYQDPAYVAGLAAADSGQL